MTTNDMSQPTTPAAEAAPPAKHRSWRRRTALFLVLAAAGATAGVTIFSGIRDRTHAEAQLAVATQAAAVPSVTVIYPKTEAPNEDVVLPGTTQAFIDTPIYARINGYLKRWYFDIGAHVKKGDLLAEIDAPEVDQQLEQAYADVTAAQARMRLSQITANRNEALLKTQSVATQARDNAVGAYLADKALVQAAQKNAARLEQLQGFEKVYAPFDGVITQRNTDVGHLINAGANSPTSQLFHLDSRDRLRIFVAVPEVDAPAARIGEPVTVTADEYPGETFHATLVRTSSDIELASRTLNVEVDTDNTQGRLLPGAYVFVHLSLPGNTNSVIIPANTLLFRREGLQVGVVRQNHAELVSVRIGRDYGDSVEIVSGLKPADAVIVNPSDSLISGAPVETGAPQVAEAGK
jgi:RND family efflux transporter MFP subunit